MKETTRGVVDTVEVPSADRHGFQGSDGVFARQVSLRISFRFLRWMDYLHICFKVIGLVLEPDIGSICWV
ncbi:hypothetical protein M5K25_025464 [Dendrobium thyrsiflorum]|uniref:Uncharacterized protein n=1 Tax=Dendrobium thyrsiflorum TaxID=117978 RepID=A0ABD0U4B7_DENTH